MLSEKKKNVLAFFRGGNCLVCGHKGTGKDMLFSWVIKCRDKAGEPHSANIKYSPKTRVRPVNAYALHKNTMKNFISNEFVKEDKTFREKEDYYISEAGLSLPAWAHLQLEREYPTFPIVYALSRHLAEFNIHANAQSFTAIWDKLRVQADTYIWCERCKVFFGKIVRQRFVVYNRSESALEHIQPFKVRRNILGVKNKDDLAQAQLFNAKYGYIERFTLWHILPKFKYDTRIFHYKIYGEIAPTIKKNKRKTAKK